MAVFVCGNCGATKETRCKPKACPQCGSPDSMKKQEEAKK